MLVELPKGDRVECAHSALAPAAVARQVDAWWGLEVNGAASLISYGLNDHFFQPTASGPVVVRVYQHGWRTDDDVLWELELLTHLRQAGAPVAAPIPTADGGLAVTVEAPEGRRQIAVLEYAAGRDTWSQWSAQSDGSHLAMAKTYGRAVGTIHRLADSFSCGRQRFRLDLDYLIDTQLADVAARLDARPGDLDFLHQAAAAVRPQLDAFAAAEPDFGPCHGDLHGGNASGDPAAVTIYDFDCGGPGWRAYDLAVLRWSIATSSNYYDVSGQWESVLDGYTTERSLADADLEATVPFAVVRQLFFFGIHGKNSGRAGYGWQGDTHFNWGLAFLRRWLDEGPWV